MEIRFNVTGSKRKELATIISEVIGQKLVYKGMPSAAYEVADITISKDGTVTYDERTEDDSIKAIIEKAGIAGFTAEATAQTESAPPEASTDETEADAAASASSTGLVISFPADKVNLENLRKLLESKATLIKKALEVKAFPIEEYDNQVSFPWWPTMPDFDAITAYTSFLAALCKMSKQGNFSSEAGRSTQSDRFIFGTYMGSN